MKLLNITLFKLKFRSIRSNLLWLHLLFLPFFLINLSCQRQNSTHAPHSETTTPTDSKNTQNTKALAGPSYLKDIKPIFEKSCIACHGKGSPKGNWMDYPTAFSKKELIKSRVFTKKDMPQGFDLPEDKRKLIADWVDNGAPEKTSDDSESQNPPPSSVQNPTQIPPQNPPLDSKPNVPNQPPASNQSDPTKNLEDTLTYVDHIKPLFEKYCSLCHNENTAGSPMPNWLQYDVVVLKADAIFNRLILKKNMPPEGMDLPAPTEAEKQLFLNWTLKGMKYDRNK
jgi:cytochrome c5